MSIVVKQRTFERSGETGFRAFTRVESGKHMVSVYATEGGLMVCVENAAHRAFRGLGKRFQGYNDAVASYKTPAIRAALAAVCELDKAAIVGAA